MALPPKYRLRTALTAAIIFSTITSNLLRCAARLGWPSAVAAYLGNSGSAALVGHFGITNGTRC